MKDILSYLTCSNCAHENLPDAEFCENCGQALDRVCINCGTQNKAEAKFCRRCGTTLAATHLEHEKSMLSELQQSAPEGLQEKMRASSSQIEGERKPVTILFTDIVGSTAIAEKLDPEVWKEIVSGAHRRVGEAIYRYEGTIAQLLGDGVLAFFGAPITHEDDPVRAVRAALDIQDSIKDYEQDLEDLVESFQMRIGINTGEVVIGNIGTDMHMEYLALGDAVNIAARLQSAADPGKTLLSVSSGRLIGDAFELKSLGEISVKGKEEPVETYELLGFKAPTEFQAFQTPYVGREAEVEALRSSLLKLCEGHGQIISLIGEAGIGKTRLLEEVREVLCEKDEELNTTSTPPSSIRWLEGRALSYGGSLSFWAITQLLLADLGLSDGASQVKIKVALRQRIDELFNQEKPNEILAYLSILLGIDLEGIEKERLETLDGATLKAETHRALRDYFTQVARKDPTVLIFEDMHWADPSSLEVLEGLMPLTDQVPLMIFMLMRIERDHRSWGVKLKAETDLPHRTRELHLRRLLEGESSNLLEQLLGSAHMPEKIWQTIMERSEGNPFYLEEVAHHLTELKLIFRDEEGWHAAEELEEIGIPETLQGVLLARIDRLEENVRHTLQIASVIGKSFLYRILETIVEAEVQLDAHLSQLQRIDLVREKSRTPELEYIFKHTLTQEATYNSLLHERRKEFHLKVGEALENLFPDRVDEFYGLLAHHFENTNNRENAVNYLILAGDKARLEDAFDEAKDFYRRAISLLTEMKDNERAARTWLKLGLIATVNFDFEAAYQANEKAFSLDQLARAKQRLSLDEDRYDPKTLRMFYRGSHYTLDPGKAAWSLNLGLIYQLFAGLVQFDSEMNVVPCVARSWEVLDGGKRYLFHLREDVRWTDGTPVTADDFEWSWIRNLSLGDEAYLPGQLDEVTGARDFRLGRNPDPKSVGIRALNLFTLEIRLINPVAYFIYIVTTPMTFPLPSSVIEQHGDDWWKPEHIISNGAYVFISYQNGTFELERNPQYFGNFPGNTRTIQLQHSLDSEASTKKYIDNELDILMEEPMRLIPPGVPAEEIYPLPNLMYVSYIAFDPNRPPLDDPRVRLALAHALDRKRVVKAYGGPGIRHANGGVIPIGMAGHSPGISHVHDIELGKQYLAEAGYPNGQDFPNIFISVPKGLKNTPEDMKQQWHETLGIDLTLQSTSISVDPSFVPEIQAMCMGWVADYPDPDNILRQSAIYNSLSAWGWRHERYEELVKTAASTPDRARRLEMYRQADHILVVEETLVIPFGYGNVREEVDLVKPWVKGYSRDAFGYIRIKDFRIEND